MSTLHGKSQAGIFVLFYQIQQSELTGSELDLTKRLTQKERALCLLGSHKEFTARCINTKP